jgi:4-hydroxybenzoate polyprenyltransferase
MPTLAPTAGAGTLLSDVRAAAGDIKLAHSVFALPFALLGAGLSRSPQESLARTALSLVLVVGCMVLARTWAMLVNRLADARFDALNPRTAQRAIPAGRLDPARGRRLAALAAAGFLLVCAAFLTQGNPWPLLLGPLVLAWLAFYSFAKRFTWWCHVLLGTALGISPVAAAIAVNPASLAHTPALWWLLGMVTCWVAGFDVIYALQDTDFDRANGLNSIPARFGPERAIVISRALHVGAFAMLIAAALSEPRFGVPFALAVGTIGFLLIFEHLHLARRGRAGIEMAFFTVNGIVSCVAGALGLLDLFI